MADTPPATLHTDAELLRALADSLKSEQAELMRLAAYLETLPHDSDHRAETLRTFGERLYNLIHSNIHFSVQAMSVYAGMTATGRIRP